MPEQVLNFLGQGKQGVDLRGRLPGTPVILKREGHCKDSRIVRHCGDVARVSPTAAG